jgi:hypothetical protein
VVGLDVADHDPLVAERGPRSSSCMAESSAASLRQLTDSVCWVPRWRPP